VLYGIAAVLFAGIAQKIPADLADYPGNGEIKLLLDRQRPGHCHGPIQKFCVKVR
jgi:hypothetical protein